MTASSGTLARPRSRLHPLVVDALVASVTLLVVLIISVTTNKHPGAHAAAAGGFGERPLPAHTVVTALLGAGALVLRRRSPGPVLGATLVLTLAELILGTVSHPPAERHTSMMVMVALALFTVAAATDRATTLRVGTGTLALITVAGMLLGAQPWYASENFGIIAWTALAALAGDAVRHRRAAVDAIRERAERAEATREEEARRRVAEERLRIARELHDVVAHHIALVNVQAGVASHVMDSRPDQAKEALAQVRLASRQALSELQTTVGLLRHRDDPVAPTEPTKGLAVLGDLVDGFTRAGMAVVVERSGADEPPLPSAVDLAAYRVVQEALTNVHKHAGPDAKARVRILRTGRGDGARLEVTVLDDGPGGAPVPAGRAGAGGGHGLTGMRERAAALGGSCETEPLEGGGFRVRVVLPLRSPGGPAVERSGADRGWTLPCV
ncbi:two-component sensor histidine kinase [Streptomyces harbinensis]|uniref:sensor histidine kinase n=1 Tax=Streptomyces harbinensis TaxID=1176198 RepID=UPI0015912072|nr:histidine kinase [Streptomyces harbinensis]QKV68427.1 two-component sensor histidine kinase [Streptomyces harbinensis]